MKNLLLIRMALITALFFCGDNLFCQDTLFMKTGETIATKIIELNDMDIKYKEFNYLEGPTFTISKEQVSKIKFQNGRIIIIEKDELAVYQEDKILDKRSVYKIQPFGLLTQNLTVGYERVIHTGLNFEGKVGFIFPKQTNSPSNGQVAKESGFFLRPSLKFFLGTDIIQKGMRYAHPLKGKYVKFEPVYTFMDIRHKLVTIEKDFTTTDPFGYTYSGTQTVSEYKNVRIHSVGGHIIYGRQFLLGNVMTLDYYVGVGAVHISMKSTDGTFIDKNRNHVGYLHSHASWGGLSGTAGIAIGFIAK